MIELEPQVRPAQAADQQRIASLIHFEPYVHRHLDWRAPLDWLGVPEFWVLERQGRTKAAMAAPPDPGTIFWLRLLAVAGDFPLQDAWNSLFDSARAQLSGAGGCMAAIALQDWLRGLLLHSGFGYLQKIIMLEWHDHGRPLEFSQQQAALIRGISAADLPDVAALDEAAFHPLWRNSLSALQQAWAQSSHATVAEVDGHVVGYQISTANSFGMHLARLAVAPAYQGRGIGRALVHDLAAQSRQLEVGRITVNTQDDNTTSMALYEHFGFRRTFEEYPVYVYNL